MLMFSPSVEVRHLHRRSVRQLRLKKADEIARRRDSAGRGARRRSLRLRKHGAGRSRDRRVDLVQTLHHVLQRRDELLEIEWVSHFPPLQYEVADRPNPAKDYATRQLADPSRKKSS